MNKWTDWTIFRKLSSNSNSSHRFTSQLNSDLTDQFVADSKVYLKEKYSEELIKGNIYNSIIKLQKYIYCLLFKIVIFISWNIWSSTRFGVPRENKHLLFIW